MHRRTLLPLLWAAFTLAANPLALRGEDRDAQAGTNLLEGKDLTKNWTTKGNWKLDDEGVAALTPRPGESGWSRWDAYLWSNREYDDFAIDFEYRVEPKGNSGFYFNVGDKNDPVAKGIEVQIYDSHDKGPDAKLTDHDSGGVIPGIPPTKSTAKPAGDWNHFQITVKGERLTVQLNGETVNEVNLKDPKLAGRPDKGYIGFQDHGLPLAAPQDSHPRTVNRHFGVRQLVAAFFFKRSETRKPDVFSRRFGEKAAHKSPHSKAIWSAATCCRFLFQAIRNSKARCFFETVRRESGDESPHSKKRFGVRQLVAAFFSERSETRKPGVFSRRSPRESGDKSLHSI